MKKILSICLVLIWTLSLTLSVFAAGDLVVDNAGLLSAEEEQSLNNRLSELKSKYNMDFAVLTTDSTEGQSVQTYADNYYDQNGYTPDGAILVINMDKDNGGAGRGWWLSTAGECQQDFTDYGIRYVGEQMSSSLSQGNYHDAFMSFADVADKFVEQAREGHPYDEQNIYREPPEAKWPLYIIIALIGGFILALLITSAQKSRHRTIRSQVNATEYMVPGSLNLTNSTETFLYATLSTVPIAQNNTGRPGGGMGGSTTHMSSGGVSHGGGGGSF